MWGFVYRKIGMSGDRRPVYSQCFSGERSRGALINGTEFDNSSRLTEPAAIPLSGVIKGWKEALQMMKVGSKWNLYVPAHLAYGERQFGRIPPNSTLVFEVELLSTVKDPNYQARQVTRNTGANTDKIEIAVDDDED